MQTLFITSKNSHRIQFHPLPGRCEWQRSSREAKGEGGGGQLRASSRGHPPYRPSCGYWTRRLSRFFFPPPQCQATRQGGQRGGARAGEDLLPLLLLLQQLFSLLSPSSQDSRGEGRPDKKRSESASRAKKYFTRRISRRRRSHGAPDLSSLLREGDGK